MPDFTTRTLDDTTWQDFADLVERHNGVWGGCWCIGFHTREPHAGKRTVDERRAWKERLVHAGHAHAALVYDGERSIAWCQFGPTAELMAINRQRAYDEGFTGLPDWRITCFFVDKAYRGKGVADVALAGALREIARLGGGTVESYPELIDGRKTSSSFLYNATVAMFERQGFERGRQIGKHHWVVSKVIAPFHVVSR